MVFADQGGEKTDPRDLKEPKELKNLKQSLEEPSHEKLNLEMINFMKAPGVEVEVAEEVDEEVVVVDVVELEVVVEIKELDLMIDPLEFKIQITMDLK
jgi:hypothetical protein